MGVRRVLRHKPRGTRREQRSVTHPRTDEFGMIASVDVVALMQRAEQRDRWRKQRGRERAERHSSLLASLRSLSLRPTVLRSAD